MRSRIDNVFAITGNYQDENVHVGFDSTVDLHFDSSVASYGYDGLSAYEIAVMRGDFNGSEGEWLEYISSGGSSGGGESVKIDIDKELSETSTNPVENRVITRSLKNKQDSLIDGQNIKTINGHPILGQGNIEIEGGNGTIDIDSELSKTSTNPVENRVVTNEFEKKQDILVNGQNIKTINGQNILGSGNIEIEASAPIGPSSPIDENTFVIWLRKYIDNQSIVWDADNKVIKSKIASVFYIDVSSDSEWSDKYTLNIDGDCLLVSKIDNGKRILVNSGRTLTLSVIPSDGYEIESISIDGSLAQVDGSIVLSDIYSNYAISVTLREKIIITTDFLVRSDLPGVYYSSTQSALDAVQEDYPNGLTQDVEITCIEEDVTEGRTGSRWLSVMKNFNKNSMYTLTINGANKLTYDCHSGGGLYFEHVDNVVIKGISIDNWVNDAEYHYPEELSAIQFIGNAENYARNLYVDQCNMNGTAYKNASALGHNGIVCKNAENVYMVDSRIVGCNCIALKLVDCHFASLIKNYIDASVSWGIIAHPALCTLSNSYGIIAEDCYFTGTTGEYFFYLTNVDRIIFRRNSFVDGGGEAFNISSKVPIKKVIFEENLFANMLSQPTVSWGFHVIKISGSIDTLNVLNNTVWMKSKKSWQQWFLRLIDGAEVGTLNLFNNVIASNVDSGIPFYCVEFGVVNTINSGNNVYQNVLSSEGVTSGRIFKAAGITGTNNIASLQEQGLETNSILVGIETKIIGAQNDIDSYDLLASREYYADERYCPDIDIEYNRKASSNNLCGCYNRNGSLIDEESDTSNGYTGEDFDLDVTFSQSAQHETMADSVMLLMHNTLDRTKFIRMKAIGENYDEMILGRYGIMSLIPDVDENGEYVRDKLYTINIE